jgi:hypothetical protein
LSYTFSDRETGELYVVKHDNHHSLDRDDLHDHAFLETVMRGWHSDRQLDSFWPPLLLRIGS